MHRGKPHKLLQVGVTPTPATPFPSRLDPWLNQQSPPLSAGLLRVQLPSGPPFLRLAREQRCQVVSK